MRLILLLAIALPLAVQSSPFVGYPFKLELNIPKDILPANGDRNVVAVSMASSAKLLPSGPPVPSSFIPASPCQIKQASLITDWTVATSQIIGQEATPTIRDPKQWTPTPTP